MKKVISNFIADIIIAAVLLAIGIVTFPLLPMGKVILCSVAAAFTAAYLVIYLFRKMDRARGFYFIAAAIEFAIVAIAVVCFILKQIGLLDALTVCTLIGVILWARGAVSLIREKFSKTECARQGGAWIFLFNILLVSFATYIIFTPFIPNVVINWVISIASLVAAVAFGFIAILVAPFGTPTAKK